MSEKTVIAITGPAAAGKTHLEEWFQRNLGAYRIVSSTSRRQRSGEKDGKDYHFLINRHYKFVETTTYNGHTYGITEVEMGRALRQRRSLIVAVVDPKGNNALRDFCEERVTDTSFFSIYVGTPLKDRLKNIFTRYRHDPDPVSEEYVGKLMTMFKDESSFLSDADYDVICLDYLKESEELQSNLWNLFYRGYRGRGHQLDLLTDRVTLP